MLYLTYNVDDHTDGIGSQYQRILGIYAICKKYNLNYYHTPIKNIDYQGLKSLILNIHEQKFIDKCNNRIHINTHFSGINFDDIITTKNINIQYLMYLLHKSNNLTPPKNVLLKITYPFNISDTEYSIYNYCKGLYKTIIPKNEIFTIGIHVRRGELYIVDSNRMLPNQFYLNIVDLILPILNKLNIKFVIELYTEVPENTTIITKQHIGINNRINNDITISPENNMIQDFNHLPNLIRYINEDCLDTFDRMINCNILIASRSSFSTCASYIKENGITIYHKFWHSLLDSDIEYNDPQITEKITNYISSIYKNE